MIIIKISIMPRMALRDGTVTGDDDPLVIDAAEVTRSRKIPIRGTLTQARIIAVTFNSIRVLLDLLFGISWIGSMD